MNFNASLITFTGCFKVDGAWVKGLGAAMLIAIYDYLGYYNICNLGAGVRDPGKTIPRAVITSVILVAAIYLTMNLSIIAVVPWQQAMKSEQIAAAFMEQLYGRSVAVIFTGLILWTVVACMFSITLGYSRIPYAAAENGDFLSVFSYVHPTKRYPAVSLWKPPAPCPDSGRPRQLWWWGSCALLVVMQRVGRSGRTGHCGCRVRTLPTTPPTHWPLRVRSASRSPAACSAKRASWRVSTFIMGVNGISSTSTSASGAL